nr:hypothetical protein [Tanacetum cinerariifolium]
MIKVLPPKTTKEVVARERERKARTTLLMALPEDHLAKFHKMADAKEMWEAIKSRFNSNDESKKMFQTLLSQLEIHGAGVSYEDANQKFLRVFECDVKGTTASSSSNTHNVAFVSADNTSSTNDLSTTYSVSSPSVSKSQKEGSPSYTDEVIHSFFANQSSAPQLDCDDLEQINDDRDNTQRPASQDDSKALVTIDGEAVDWSGHVEEVTQNFAMMAYSSSNSGSDNEVQSCSKTCAESYARLKKLYDEQRDKLGDASVEIIAYTLALKKVEVQLLCHQQNQLAYEPKIKFMKIDLDDKTDVLTYHKKLLAEAHKEKEDLKTKVENWQNSSKNLNRLLNTQMSANDKFGIGYGDYRYDNISSYENEVLQSVFMKKECDLENTPVNGRYAKGMHTVPLLMTGNYMPSGPDVEIDYSKFAYGPKQTSADESDFKPVAYASSDFDSSVEQSTSVPEPVVNESKVVSEPKAVSEPKVWTDAPIIEEYESDSNDDLVANVPEKKEKPSFAFTDTVKHLKSPRKNVKETGTPNHYPKIEKQDSHNHTRKGLGYAYARKSCFVCDSFSHLIRDYDFHEKRMAKQAALTKSKEKGTGQQAHRPIWNNVYRVNHQNKFVPSTILTKTGKIPVNAARQNFSRQATLTSTASKVNITRPFVNDTRPTKCFYKYHSPNKRPFHNKTAQINTFANHKVNIVNPSLSVVKGNEDTVVKALVGNKAHLADYQEFKDGSVAFGGSNRRITGKEKIKAERLDFKDVYYMEELKHYNLFLCHKCVTRRTRQDNMYSFNLKNIDPSGDLSYLFAKASIDESNKWHRRLERKATQGLLFSWVYFLKSKDETTPIFKDFTRQAENQFKHKVKTIRSDNGTKFMNQDLIELCGSKGIKREYSNAKTPQKFKVAERKNMTLIEAAKTMLADSFLPTTFWAEAVNTACYVLNRVLVTNPQNKTPYELLTGRQPIISYLRPFGCHVTILNTIDQLGKFNEKSDLRFLVGYSLNSKAFRVYNLETKRVEENMYVNFLENKPNVARKGHAWDKIRKNEKPVSPVEQIFQEELEKLKRQEKEANDATRKEATHETQDDNTNNTNLLNAVSIPDIYASPSVGIFTNSSYDDEGVVTDFNNLEITVNVSPTPTTRIHTIHPKTQILGDPLSAIQIRSKVYKNFEAHALISQALEDESWVDAMQEELLQFQIQKVWVLVDLPFGKEATRTKWVYRNKKDERGVVVRNKAHLVTQGHRQEEGIDYDEVFAYVTRIEAIMIFLAFASYMGFIVYQMDVKSAFLAWYDTFSTFLEKSGYRRGAIDKNLFIKKDKKDIMLVQVYVDDLIFGSTKKSWCDEFKELMKNRFQMSSIGELTFFLGLQTASIPIETKKPLVKDEETTDVDVYLYRSMIGSLMYLTACRPDIMFAVCACSRFQVTPKTLHLQAVKRIFRDAYEKKLIQVLKIHTDDNVADLLTKAFDQTTAGKETSNPLMADSLPITILLTMLAVKLLLFFGFIKENVCAVRPKLVLLVVIKAQHHFSNESLLLGVNTPRCDEDSLELKELMVFFVQFVFIDGIRVTTAKPAESDEFEQIIDFLNGSSVRYALTASPTIRRSCIKQFWLTAKVKTVNDEVRVQALIDGKKCLSAKTTSWNEFSSTMTSSIICLATNQKFNFSKYILLSLVKNIEARVPFYMFPRVITPIFENMLVLAAEEVGQAQDEVSIPTKPSTSNPLKKHKSKKQQPKAPKDPSPEPSPEHQLPSPSNDQIPAAKNSLILQELMDLCTRLSNKVMDLESEVIDIKSSFTGRIQKLDDIVDQLKEENRALKEKSFKTPQVDTAAPVEFMEKSFKQGRMIADMDEDVEEAQAKAYNLDLQHAEKVLSMQDIDEEEPAEVEEVLEVVKAVKLMTEVVTTAQPTTTTAAQVPKAKVQPKDKGKGILIEEPKPLKRQAQIEADEAFARQLEAELNANINWNDVIEEVKRTEK